MNTHGNKRVTIYGNAGIDATVAIKVRLAAHDRESVEINLGYGPELIIDIADVESLERLRDAAAEGARLLHERIEQNQSAAGEPNQLVGAGAAR